MENLIKKFSCKVIYSAGITVSTINIDVSRSELPPGEFSVYALECILVYEHLNPITVRGEHTFELFDIDTIILLQCTGNY